MTRLLSSLAVSFAMVLLPAVARPQEEPQPEPWSDLGIGTDSEPAAPSTAAPSELPPAPQYETPAPQYDAQPAPQAQAQQAPPAGQWVYTQQYGWIWMPYADAYTRAPANGYGEPYAYVYAPAYSCWTWVAAPWVWGFGPWPFFGVYGPARFGWYGHGWWRFPQRFHYVASPARTRFAPAPAPAFRGGPVHGGFGRPAPVFRGGAGNGGFRPAPSRGNVGFRGPSAGFVGGGRGGGPVSHGVPAARGGFGGGVFRGGGHGGGPVFTGRGGSGGHGGGAVGWGGHGRGGGHGGRGRG
jgi:hypothetical protein